MKKCKFNKNGKTEYGFNYGRELSSSVGSRQSIEGFSWVEDALTGKIRMIEDIEIEEIKDVIPEYNPEKNCFEGGDELEMFLQEMRIQAEEINKKIPAHTLSVGKIIHVPVADGEATYVITAIRGETCWLEWRGFHPDRYVDSVLRLGSILPKKAVQGMIH